MIRLFFYLHKRWYGYPCRDHVRLALSQDLATTSLKWRVGMLYVCGESVPDIAKHMDITRERVKQTLFFLTLGVKL